jgi:hypothetical protein
MAVKLTKDGTTIAGEIAGWSPRDGIGALLELLVRFGDVQPRPEIALDRDSISLEAMPGDIDINSVYGCDSTGLCLVRGDGWHFRIVPAGVIRKANKLEGAIAMRGGGPAAPIVPVRLGRALEELIAEVMKSECNTNRSEVIRDLVKEALQARGFDV